MKSIKQQYIDLKEGRMSHFNFMRNLRMTMPQYVTNVTSFNDAVKILRNKGILTENNISELGPAAQQMAGNPEEEAEYRSSLIKKESYEDDYEDEEGPDPEPEDHDYFSMKLGMIQRMADEEEKQGNIERARELRQQADEVSKQLDSILESLSEAKKTKLTADQVNNDELRMGIKVEMEHTDDPEKAKKIALDHLAENPFYYTQLKLSGVDTKATPSKEKKAIAKKKDETEMVDKKNQMKTPKGVEKVKASANKAKKETNKPEKGIKMMSLVSKTSHGVKKMDATGEKMKKIKEGLEVKSDDTGVTLLNTINKSEYYGDIEGNKVTFAVEYSDIDNITDENWKSILGPNHAFVQIYDAVGGKISTEKNYVQITVDVDQLQNKFGSKKVNVAKTIFDKNATLTTNLNKIARGEDLGYPETTSIKIKPKQSAEDKLREAIRKMVRQEMFDGRDNMTDTVGRQLDETDTKQVEDAIKSGKIKPEEVKAAAEKAMKGDSADLAMLMAFGNKPA